VAGSAVLADLLGSAGDGSYPVQAGLHAAIGAALCAVGADFRRWWGLAFLGLTATVAAREAEESETSAAPGAVARGAALAMAGLLFRNMRVYPGGQLRIDRVLPITR